MIAAVIPTTGRSDLLPRCVDALLNQTARPETVHIVLTGSQVGDERSLPAGVRVTWSSAPGSFCAAVNEGIRTAAASWVLVLNDDVVLQPDYLQQLFAGLPADPRIGMVCGRLRSADGRHLDSTGQFRRRNWTAGERGYGEVDRGQYDRGGYVESVCAAAALYRLDMLDAIARDGQYFDEDFSMYLEDLELGLRAQRAGWRAYYVPNAIGTHVRGATAKRMASGQPRWWPRYYLPQLPSPLVARYVRNRYRLMHRYGRWPTLLRDTPWLLGYEARLWAYLLLCRPRVVRELLA